MDFDPPVAGSPRQRYDRHTVLTTLSALTWRITTPGSASPFSVRAAASSSATSSASRWPPSAGRPANVRALAQRRRRRGDLARSVLARSADFGLPGRGRLDDPEAGPRPLRAERISPIPEQVSRMIEQSRSVFAWLSMLDRITPMIRLTTNAAATVTTMAITTVGQPACRTAPAPASPILFMSALLLPAPCRTRRRCESLGTCRRVRALGPVALKPRVMYVAELGQRPTTQWRPASLDSGSDRLRGTPLVGEHGE
jgi:hypothetical protein